MCCHSDEKQPENPKPKKDIFLGGCIIAAAAILGFSWVAAMKAGNSSPDYDKDFAALEKIVLPAKGVTLPVRWGDMGKRLVDSGVIDQEKFEGLYAQRARLPDGQGGLDGETKKLLTGSDNGKLVMTKENANIILNLLWALGLGNKNVILEKGPMIDKEYGGDPSRFASTGGWSLADGQTMDHYSKHELLKLSPEQQAIVERVAKNIYRPCCGNSTFFPDCNHGMAMLGLLELMASQGVEEEEMYEAALQVNAFWFPDTYLTIAKYLKTKGDSWQKADPKEILGYDYSSAAGYRRILSEVTPPAQKGGGSCGV